MVAELSRKCRPGNMRSPDVQLLDHHFGRSSMLFGHNPILPHMFFAHKTLFLWLEIQAGCENPIYIYHQLSPCIYIYIHIFVYIFILYHSGAYIPMFVGNNPDFGVHCAPSKSPPMVPQKRSASLGLISP